MYDLLILVFIVGYVVNVVQLIRAADRNRFGSVIARLFGVLFFPLGGLLGIVWW